MAHQLEQRQVGDRVRVEPAPGEVDALLVHELLELVYLPLLQPNRLDDAAR